MRSCVRERIIDRENESNDGDEVVYRDRCGRNTQQ